MESFECSMLATDAHLFLVRLSDGRWEMEHAIKGMKSSKARLRIRQSGGKCIREVKNDGMFLVPEASFLLFYR